MGRPRKPTALKVLQGNLGKRPIQPEPEPQGEPQKPEFLDTIGEELRDDIVPRLVQLGLATSVDTPLLTAMCQWWSECRRADTSSGNDYRRILMRAAAWKQFSAVAAKFGLSPSDRVGLPTVEKADDNDPFQAVAATRTTDGRRVSTVGPGVELSLMTSI